MANLDWLKTIAPTVATALGGPLAGIAVDVVGKALGWTDATKETIETALVGNQLTGDQLLALKQAEIDLKAKEQELGVKFAQLEVDDRNGARDREVKTGDSATPRWIAFCVIGGFFGILVSLMVYGVPDKGGEALLILLGSLGASFTAIIAYYFGSTKGSADKTALIAKAASGDKQLP